MTGAILAVFVAGALPGAVCALAADAPDSTSLGRAIDACVAPLNRAGELSGQLVVARDGKVLVERCWGSADREHRRPMTPTMRLCIASITRPVNQEVALQLEHQGRFAFPDTIGRFLPGYPHERITIQQLMNHQGGIPHRVTTGQDEEHAMLPADVTELAGRTPLMRPRLDDRRHHRLPGQPARRRSCAPARSAAEARGRRGGGAAG